MATAATIRRPRGGLEELVRDVCDRIEAGEFGDTGPWTTQRLANLITENYPGSGVSPSTGAIGDNLKRWGQIGFARISEVPPLAFVGYTDEAREHGLAELKKRRRQLLAAERKAAKENGQNGASHEAPVAEAPEPTGQPGAHGVDSWSEAS